MIFDITEDLVVLAFALKQEKIIKLSSEFSQIRFKIFDFMV
jgi:hypothetical protein